MGIIVNAFDHYIISIHTLNDERGYKFHKVIECYRGISLIAYLIFSEGQSGQQNSFGSPKTPAPYMLYFDMSLFDDVYNLIQHDSHPAVGWDPDTGDGSVRNGSSLPVGQ